MSWFDYVYLVVCGMVALGAIVLLLRRALRRPVRKPMQGGSPVGTSTPDNDGTRRPRPTSPHEPV